MLFESEVIDAVCDKLESLGYKIQQKLQTNQQGDDIVAEKSGISQCRIFIEAKGETSSRKTSERFGRPFDSAQVRVHVAEAFYKAAQVLSVETNKEYVMISGIALPNTQLHQNCVKNIQSVLDRLNIVVLWVHENKTVQISSSFEL